MLLEASIPRPRGGWFWYAGGVFLLIVLLSTYIERGVANGRQIVNFLSSLIMLALIGAMGYMTWRSARQVQGEQLKLAAIEELMQMRRWPEAAWMLQEMLMRPTRTPQGRLGGLVFLSSVLARYHRFHDAIVVVSPNTVLILLGQMQMLGTLDDCFCHIRSPRHSVFDEH